MPWHPGAVGQGHLDVVDAAVDDEQGGVPSHPGARDVELDEPVALGPAVAHGSPVRGVPLHVPGAVVVHLTAERPHPLAQCRQRLAHPDEVARRGEELLLPGLEVPVDPRRAVVLAVGVVVAALRAPQLVTGVDHRDAGRQQQRAEQVADGQGSGGEHRRVVGRALDPVVPRAVAVAAVPVVLAVGLVVLVVVGDEVGGREAVVGGDEVDRGGGAAVAVAEQVA